MKILILILIIFLIFKINLSKKVFVKLPYNVVNGDGKFLEYEKIKSWLIILKRNVNVDGVVVHINWGVAQPTFDFYNFDGYVQLIKLIIENDLKIIIELDFQSCGNNVEEETCNFLLPDWVRQVAYKYGNWDIFYTDRSGYRDQEYISLGVDDVPVFPNNKTGINLYEDFVKNFKNVFKDYFSSISTIYVGLGPAGELRYPSYQIQQTKWIFPGIGEFQCYDFYMLQNLAKHATEEQVPDWGKGGPMNSRKL